MTGFEKSILDIYYNYLKYWISGKKTDACMQFTAISIHRLFVTRFEKSGFHAHNKTHFSHQTIAVHIDWQFKQVLMLKVAWANFAVACFWGFSDIHNCLGHLPMAVYPLGKQTASCNSPHNWLMSLAMDLAALCDMWRWKWHQWMPFGWF